MASNTVHAQPPLEFVPPDLQNGIVRLVGAAVPLVLRYSTSVSQVETRNVEPLARLYDEFQRGEARFMIAFRHPGTTDPLSICYLLSHSVPAAAVRLGLRLKAPTHTYFLYDRGVPLWAGSGVAWLLPKMGGISLQRGKLDRMGLKTAREKFIDGDQPMTVAPEGSTNGLNEIVSPLEPGAAQLAFWCLEDLRARQRGEKVYIVPLGIRYQYLSPPWAEVDQVLTGLETECGLERAAEIDRYQRLIRIGEHLLAILEGYYSRFYQQELLSDSAMPIGERLSKLLEAALRTSEQYFNIQPKGSMTDRCRRIEQAGWDRIYREDLKGQHLSPVQRGLADRVAEEADRRMWHMRIVETFVAVTGTYVKDSPSADRFAETVSLLDKTVQRLKGHSNYTAAPLGKQRVVLNVGQPILADDRYTAYTANRQGARQAVADLTRDLQTALQEMLTPGKDAK